MGSEDKTIPEWCNIKCEKIVEEIAPPPDSNVLRMP